jgi:hypothetical protein
MKSVLDIRYGAWPGPMSQQSSLNESAGEMDFLGVFQKTAFCVSQSLISAGPAPKGREQCAANKPANV